MKKIMLSASFKAINTKKKRILIFVGIVLLVLVGWVVYELSMVENGLNHTENIADYNSGEYPIFSDIFLDEIPSNAKVVSFSYYDYWKEEKEIYLELEFDSAEAMDNYLASLKEHCLESVAGREMPSGFQGEWLLEKQNPHDSQYTDLFCLSNTVATQMEGTSEVDYYTGYSIDMRKNRFFYKCYYAVISYSYEDLRVIQSDTSGNFYDRGNNYIPKFLLRFSVPLTEDYNRMYALNWRE